MDTSRGRGNSRRNKAIAKLRGIESVVSSEHKAYLEEIRIIIVELDAMPEGVLKVISNLDRDPAKAIKKLEELVPYEYIDRITKTSERSQGQEELLVLTEEFLNE